MGLSKYVYCNLHIITLLRASSLCYENNILSDSSQHIYTVSVVEAVKIIYNETSVLRQHRLSFWLMLWCTDFYMEANVTNNGRGYEYQWTRLSLSDFHCLSCGAVVWIHLDDLFVLFLQADTVPLEQCLLKKCFVLNAVQSFWEENGLDFHCPYWSKEDTRPCFS